MTWQDILKEEKKRTRADIVTDLANNLIDIVENIENAQKRTKGHYDRYMVVFERAIKPGRPFQKHPDLFRDALIEAGGNKYGVDAAYKLVTGQSFNPMDDFLGDMSF